MLGSPILYLKGMRRMMFQLSGFYYMIYCSYLGTIRGMVMLEGVSKAWVGFRVNGLSVKA